MFSLALKGASTDVAWISCWTPARSRLPSARVSPKAGQVGEIIRPGDLQDISAVFFPLSAEPHQSHDPGHVVSTSTGKPA